MSDLIIGSFGGGVQSTAIAILAAERKIKIDSFVFADTGFEQSIVFEFLEKYTLPMLKDAKIPFYIASTRDYAGQLKGKSCFADWLLPPFFHSEGQAGAVSRLPAYCSSKWKAEVLTKFINEKFGKKNNFTMLMGFSIDEKHRALRKIMGEKDADVFFYQTDMWLTPEENEKRILDKINSEKKARAVSKKWQYDFPLLNLTMNRGDCVALVQKTFNVMPPRSSCYFCPNHTMHEWREVMAGPDREKVIGIDKLVRYAAEQQLPGVKQFLTVECKPIEECDFDDKNEVIFSRLCSGECFL